MNLWSLAVGNLTNLPRTPVLVPSKRTRNDARNAAKRPICPHCGQSMNLPDGPKPFTDAEDRTLTDMHESGSSRMDIARALKRPPSSVTSRIKLLGLRAPSGNGRES